jgi:hypothetical protein
MRPSLPMAPKLPLGSQVYSAIDAPRPRQSPRCSLSGTVLPVPPVRLSRGRRRRRPSRALPQTRARPISKRPALWRWRDRLHLAPTAKLWAAWARGAHSRRHARPCVRMILPLPINFLVPQPLLRNQSLRRLFPVHPVTVRRVLRTGLLLYQESWKDLPVQLRSGQPMMSRYRLHSGWPPGTMSRLVV